MLVVVWNKDETPSDPRRPQEINDGIGSDLVIRAYNPRYFGEAFVQRLRTEAGGYPVSIVEKEISRVATGIGYGENWHSKLQGLLDDNLGMSPARDRHDDVYSRDHGKTPPKRSTSSHNLHGDTIGFGHPDDTLDVGTAVQVRFWNPGLIATPQIDPVLSGVALSPTQRSNVRGDGIRILVGVPKSTTDNDR